MFRKVGPASYANAWGPDMKLEPGDDCAPVEVREHLIRGLDGGYAGQTVFRYDAQDREWERTGYDAKDRVTYRMECSPLQLEAGRELRTTTYRPDGMILQTSVNRFDQEDRVIEIIWRAADATVIERQVYAYFDDERTVRYTRYGKAGKVVEEWTRANP
jgi:hypothetical protein